MHYKKNVTIEIGCLNACKMPFERANEIREVVENSNIFLEKLLAKQGEKF